MESKLNETPQDMHEICKPCCSFQSLYAELIVLNSIVHVRGVQTLLFVSVTVWSKVSGLPHKHPKINVFGGEQAESETRVSNLLESFRDVTEQALKAYLRMESKMVGFPAEDS